MSVEAEVLEELRRLRTRVPHLTGSLAASVDGLVLAQDAPGVEPEGLAALTAAALGVAHRMADATLRGEFRELLVRGAHGYLATYAAGPTAVLTLLAEDRANVGRLHLEGRHSGACIATLVETLVEAEPVAGSTARGRTRASSGDRASSGERASAGDRAPAPAGEPGEHGRGGRTRGALPIRGASRTRSRAQHENGRPGNGG